MANAELHVQVWYAPPPPALPVMAEMQVPGGTTIDQALATSGLQACLPGVDLRNCRFGIWGKLKTGETVLREHDRIEIYRPLIADPKEARHRRADKKASAARERG